MAAASGHEGAQREKDETNENAQVGSQEGGDGEVTVSGALIRCECAFTYMNAVSGENLTGVFLPMNSAQVSRMTLAAHSTPALDIARFLRTTATCLWGVSDPRTLGAGP